MSLVDRRTFLKGVAATTASAMVADSLLAAATPATARAASGPVWKKTPCPLCALGCGLMVAIQDGRAIAVKGDPDSPASRGLACVKGYHAIQTLYARDRITRALVRRTGQRGVTRMSDALDVVARQLDRAFAESGPTGVALYGSGGWTVADAFVASRFFHGALNSRNVDTSARLDAASARAGLIGTFGLDGTVGCFDDVDHADVFVLWDHNMAETDPVLFSRVLQRRRTNPATRIVVLGTRTTRTSYAADRSLLYAPESESAIANAICHELVARGWVDHGFVDRHVAFKRGPTGIGYDIGDKWLLEGPTEDASWRDYVRFLDEYAPERAQAVSGLAADDVRWLASLYGNRGLKVMSIWGTAANQHARGTWLNNVLYNIHLLGGKLATPGNGALCLMSEGGAAAGAIDAGMTPHNGPGVVALFRAVEQGAIRFLWIQDSDPLANLPNVDRYRKALRSGRCFVVASAAYPTPTTDIADVVLPTAMWLEHDGVVANAERRAEYVEQMLAPPGEAAEASWQMIEVARRIGRGSALPWDREHHAAAAFDAYARLLDDPRRRLPSITELHDGPGALWPFVNGRETKWRYNTAYDAAADRSRGDFDFYGHPDHRAWVWLRPYEPPAESPDREYPFWLETGRVLEHCGTGTLTQRIPALHRAVPHAYVELNRDDANALGVRTGDAVRLVSRRGTLELEARIEYRSQPVRGRVFVPTFDEAHPVNRLTIDAGCPLSGQPTGRCAVRVERASGARA